MRKAFMIGIAIILTAFLGCDTTEPDNEISSAIKGIVTDSVGNPVPDAAIFLDYNLEGLLLPTMCAIDSIDDPEPPFDSTRICNYPNPFSSATTIAFRIARPGESVLWIENFTRTDSIRIFLLSSLSPGFYEVVWDASDDNGLKVESGVYWVYLKTGDTVDSESMFVNRGNYSEFSWDEMRKTFVTDNQGRFSIPQESLPFGYVGQEVDIEGNIVGEFEVTRYLNIWALHESYNTVHVDSVFIDPQFGADIEIQFAD